MPLCHHAAIQHVTAVQHRLLQSPQSISQPGPDVPQQLTEGKHGMSSQRGSILHVGQHLPVQLLRLRFHLTASTQLHKQQKHLDKSCWKSTSTSEVVSLTYGSAGDWEKLVCGVACDCIQPYKCGGGCYQHLVRTRFNLRSF
ncbi:hypothetical protein PBY51_010193 [Eleginops maclovinus]|uniref:Uncharacterized protein n=1 Tax=Eleginops maclovinus TaxID=56733 RepID=A0AAN8AIZ5_ELEMC|nr:hypothetical protein PBY51_010193 [Eleginops maclovinus]